MTQLRCATYSRYSSDRQREASIVDQQRNMMRFAESRGWRIDPDLMFSDEAISGAGLDRPGYQALLRATKACPRRIDVVLVDDTSRISRSLAETVRLREELNFRGIRFVAVSQGIDSNDDQSDVMMTVHGLVDSLYIKELGKKTHRGLEGLALTGFHTGGSCFGYQSEKVGDRTRLRIDKGEAEIVRRIFEMSAACVSLKKIAKQLNEEGVPPPRGTKKKTRPSWVFTAIREMLRRDLYRGRIVWNRRKYKKKPGSNKRISVLRPESEWVITEEPELRIVSEELWNRVQARLRETVENHPGMKPGLLHRAATVPYLFSGLLKCGDCGANLTILTGRGKEGKRAAYGCSHHSIAVSVRTTCISGAINWSRACYRACNAFC
jgi:DNA invertase Pin-like site-specific DNA recombinase